MTASAARSTDPPRRALPAAERRRRNADSAKRTRLAKKLQQKLAAEGFLILRNFLLDPETLARLAQKFPAVHDAAGSDDDLAHELHELLDTISWQ